MLNRVAVLSDIHGVLPALEAVLAEQEVSAADRIVLTGDISAGPQPAQVLDRLAGLGDRVLWISGNADRELLEYRRGQHFDLEAAVTQVSQESSYPDITEWADYFLHARATDADALGAFAPRDGRDQTP